VDPELDVNPERAAPGCIGLSPQLCCWQASPISREGVRHLLQSSSWSGIACLCRWPFFGEMTGSVSAPGE